MRTKIPVVSGHVTSAEYLPARYLRISPTETTRPFRTVRMNASTSRGLGTSMIPRPNRFRIAGGISTTFGRFGLSIFDRQVLRVRMARLYRRLIEYNEA